MTPESHLTMAEDRGGRRFMHLHARGMYRSIGKLAVCTLTAGNDARAVGLRHSKARRAVYEAPIDANAASTSARFPTAILARCGDSLYTVDDDIHGTAPVGPQEVVDHLRPTKQSEQAPENVIAWTDGAAEVERKSATYCIGQGRTA